MADENSIGEMNTVRSENDELDMQLTMKSGDFQGEVIGRVDRYFLLKKLGQGGFGAVYLAYDNVVKVNVAVKALPGEIANNPEEMERVRENFALVSRLHHPNIVSLLHLHQLERIDSDAQQALHLVKGDFLVVMEYAEGSTLSSWKKLFNDKKVPFEVAVDIVSQIAEALDYAHEQKIIHRDIKPANIIVAGSTSDVKVRVLDFGLAAEIRSSMSRVSQDKGSTSGTRAYMAPEQWRGKKQGGYTDQYSLAVLFYELITGEVPFASVYETNDDMLMKNVVLSEIPDKPDNLTGQQIKSLFKALEKEPRKRYSNCKDFVESMVAKPVSILKPLAALFLIIAIAAIAFVVTKNKGKAVVETVTTTQPATNIVEQPPVEKPVEVVTEPVAAPKTEPVKIEPAKAEPEQEETVKVEPVEPAKTETTLSPATLNLAKNGSDLFVNSVNTQLALHKYHDLQKKYNDLLNKEKEKLDVYGGKLWNELSVNQSLKSNFDTNPDMGITVFESGLKKLNAAITEADNIYYSGLVKQALRDAQLFSHQNDFKKALSILDSLSIDVNKTGQKLIDQKEKLRQDIIELQAVSEMAKRVGQVVGVLQDAEIYAHNGNWEKVKSLLEKLVITQELHGVRSEKLIPFRDKLLTKAKEMLIPKLKIVTKINGITTSGVNMKFLDKIWTSPALITLHKGGIYKFIIEPQQYKGRHFKKSLLQGSVNWVGEKEVIVNLVEYIGPIHGEKWLLPYPGITFAYVQNGNFVMGNNSGNVDQKPAHAVTISRPFWLGTHEVTQQQWQKIMGNTPSHYKGPNNPVDSVSWELANRFCQKLTQIEREAARLPAGYVYRLPTEAEWEFAARGGVKTKNYLYCGSNNAGEVAWYYENSGDEKLHYSKWNVKYVSKYNCHPHPVGLKKPNELGLYDMSGNVQEWCYDYYDWQYYKKSPKTDPVNKVKTSSHSLKSSTWRNGPKAMQPSSRSTTFSGMAAGLLGFRIALAPSL